MSGLRGEAKTGAPHSTLAARLAASRRRAFVGRAGELDLFRAGLSEDPSPFAVLFVHGPGGVGKTTLLRRMADDAEAAGWTAAFVDCRSAGHPAAFLPMLASTLGLDAQADPLAALHVGPRTVLILDTYEAASTLDPWLREVFLPNLPAGVLVVVAGRDRPDPAWRSDPSWHDLLRVVALRNLAPDDARALLRTRGLPEAAHAAVLQLTGGHPLALSLLADVVAETGRVPQTHGQVPDVVAALLERFVCDAASPAQRQVLQVCAHARFTTEPLLRTVVGEADAAGLFDWLRSLSFVEASPQGLWPHDLAREVLDHDLRWRDEAAYVDLHRRIREHVVRRLRATRGPEQERLMQELQYLHRHNPLLRPYLSWQDTAALTARRLRDADRPAVTALVEEFEGPESAAIAAFWAARQPDGFIVFERHGEPGISGVAAFLTVAEPTHDELAADPLTAAICRWTAAHGPLRPGEHLFVSRYSVFRHDYGRPCPEFDIVQVRSTLCWLNDSQLAWSFVAAPEAVAAFWEPEMNYIDTPRAPGAEATIGGHRWVTFARDWRASPADVWLELMGERELALDLDPAQLAGERTQPLVVLSHQEFADAVRVALRHAGDPAALGGNPLARSRVVVEATGERDAGDTLVDLLVEAVDALRDGEHGDKLHRAVATTFFKGAGTQEAAAERLGLPFSTYRRHLATGVDRVAAWLWNRELHGGG